MSRYETFPKRKLIEGSEMTTFCKHGYEAHSQYAIVDFDGRVLEPDAGVCYEQACEISRAIPLGKVGHGVVNLTAEYGLLVV